MGANTADDCLLTQRPEQLAVEMVNDPTWARQLMRRLQVDVICGHALRRVADDGGFGLILDWSLEIRPIGLEAAKRFVDKHHAHCKAPVTARFQAAIYNGRTSLGVALVGNAVAPASNGRGFVEVNRLCVRRDTAAALRWNACSPLYAWCARTATRKGWTKIITYTRIDEDGISLKAAGWGQDCRVRGRGWHSGRRARSNKNSWIDKIRWSKTLVAASRQPTAEKATPPSSLSGGGSVDYLLKNSDEGTYGFMT
jgi:hypothetical protein